jgi:anti-anti-sigma factor
MRFAPVTGGAGAAHADLEVPDMSSFPLRAGSPPWSAGTLLVEIVDSSPPERLVLRVHGELDLATASDFAALVRRAGAGRRTAVLDLSALTFCDVVGAAAIERAYRQLGDAGCRLTLAGAGRALTLLLSVDGLFPELRSAAGAGKPPG